MFRLSTAELNLRLLVTFNERAMLTEDLPARRLQEVGVTDVVDCGKVFTVATMNLPPS